MGWTGYTYYKNGNRISSYISTHIGDSSGKSSYFGVALILQDFEPEDIFSYSTDDNSSGDTRVIGLY